jgi:hypothetical protein
MSSIKQVIIQAIIKVSATDPSLDREGGLTAEEARDMFIAQLMAELFPEHEGEVTIPKVPQVKPSAGSPAKLTKEEKAAAKAAKEAEKVAKAEAKAAKEAEKAAAKAAKETSPKKAVSPKKSPEDKAAAKAAKEAEKEAAKAAKEAAKVAKEAAKASAKAAKVPLPKSPKAEVNLANLAGRTWSDAMKKANIAKTLEPELLTYLNALSNAGFNARTAKEHVSQFLATRAEAPPAEAGVVVDLEVVEFQGKDYYIGPRVEPDTDLGRVVYEGVMDDTGEALVATRKVGNVGMADFKDMSLE